MRDVVGLDEAGMGPLAGPVCAAALCIMPGFAPSSKLLASVRDSKKISRLRRENMYEALVNNPLVRYATGVVSARVIDRINIRNAGRLAMKRAIVKLARAYGISLKQTTALIDGTVALSNFPGAQKSVARGDQRVYSIAAASIIAKVTRDRIMARIHKKYPQYNFIRHKGYGTQAHYAALAQCGSSPVHRKSFL